MTQTIRTPVPGTGGTVLSVARVQIPAVESCGTAVTGTGAQQRHDFRSRSRSG